MAFMPNIGLLIYIQEAINYENRLEFCLYRRNLRDISDPFSLNEPQFIQLFRLSRELARNLIDEVSAHIPEPQQDFAVPKFIKVLIALQFYGHGCYQKIVGKDSHLAVSQSTVSRSLSEVTRILITRLLDTWIKFPASAIEIATEKQFFMDKFNFPGTIGAVDGTHIAILSPPNDDLLYPGHLFINRKGYHSINVQPICNANLKSMNMNARHPGSVHDSGIFRTSTIRQQLQERYLAGDTSTWLIGDSGYGLEPWLMKPILNAQPGTPQSRYNTSILSARNCIERCFGVLKQRFRCLYRHRVLHYSPLVAGQIIYACGILHNMCLQYNVEIPYEEDRDLEHVNDEDRNEEPNIQDDWAERGRLVQNRILQFHFQ